MSIYQEGKPIVVGARVNPSNLSPNKEYVFQYQVPVVVFRLMSPATLSDYAKKWVNLRQSFGQEEGALFEITGVKIDTETGYIFVRGSATAPPEVMQAGVNPLAVLAVIAGVFSAIGIGVTLLFVYETGTEVLGGGSGAGSSIDPCSTGKVLDTIRCWGRRTGWVTVGVGIGVAVTVLVLLVLIGRRENFV